MGWPKTRFTPRSSLEGRTRRYLPPRKTSICAITASIFFRMAGSRSSAPRSVGVDAFTPEAVGSVWRYFSAGFGDVLALLLYLVDDDG